MKHKKDKKEFHRTGDQRKALFKALLTSLIMEEKIKTTEAKAKETKKRIDRIINKAKKIQNEKTKLAAVRDLKKIFSQAVIKKLSGDFIEKFSSRQSGYARVIRLGRRKSDGAEMAVVEFVK